MHLVVCNYILISRFLLHLAGKDGALPMKDKSVFLWEPTGFVYRYDLATDWLESVYSIFSPFILKLCKKNNQRNVFRGQGNLNFWGKSLAFQNSMKPRFGQPNSSHEGRDFPVHGKHACPILPHVAGKDRFTCLRQICLSLGKEKLHALV